MASFNKAFEGVTVVDDTVTVHGVSEQPDPADEIHVALMRPAGGDPPLVAQVVHGRAASKWPAEFPGAAPPFAVDDDVFVVGIALRPATAPFVWEGSFKITAG